jgi:hypothetical protein
MSDHAPPTVDLCALQWFKSSASGENGACVEVARISDDWVALRDSKDPAGPKYIFSGAEWGAFICAVKAGAFEPASN